MPFTPEDVHRLAHAQRLALLPEEEAAFARDLDRILDAFSDLAETPPTEVAAVPGEAREDIVRPSPWAADMLANAPRTADGRVRVPRRTGGGGGSGETHVGSPPSVAPKEATRAPRGEGAEEPE